MANVTKQSGLDLRESPRCGSNARHLTSKPKGAAGEQNTIKTSSQVETKTKFEIVGESNGVDRTDETAQTARRGSNAQWSREMNGETGEPNTTKRIRMIWVIGGLIAAVSPWYLRLFPCSILDVNAAILMYVSGHRSL